MKFLFILLIISPFQVSAQETSWTLCLNQKILLKGSDSTIKSKPATVLINTSTLKKNDTLQIEIKEPDSNIRWIRDFVFQNGEGKVLLIKKFDRDVRTFRIAFSEIRSHAGKENTIHLYTEQHPADPDLGIRSKRTFLAILEMK